MKSFKSLGFISLVLALCVLLETGVQAAGEPIDYSLRGLNEEFYAAFTQLLSSQDTSDFFGTIQMTVGQARLTKDGAEQLLDAAPEIVNGRTMLPIRAVAEAAGFTVDWDEASYSVIISDAYGGEVAASIGSNTITVNGETRKMDVTPYISSSGRSFFPVRAISEALNLDVAWDSATHSVTITAPYQTARLVVITSKDLRSALDDLELDAVAALHDGSGMWVLQFSTPSQAKAAANTLRNGEPGYQPEPDIYVMTKSAESEEAYEVKQDSWGVLDCNFTSFSADYGDRFQERITVAVVDTGVDTAHPALRGRLRPGRDFVENDNEPEDEDSHGTHVAATILDCVGGAPVDILPVRVVAKDGGSSSSRLSQGIRYAADRYAKVINISLGGALDAQYQFSNGQTVMDSAIQYAVSKGAVVVVSAGNDDSDTLYYCPANIESAGVVVVSAGDETHSRWSGSNYGKNVDLMAPGTDIIAAVPGGGYAAKTGTSMAAPHVSAAAALLFLSSGNTIKPGALEKVICSATDSGVWQDEYSGYGFLDMSRGSVPEYRPAKVFENVLMPDRCIASAYEEAFEYSVFGSEIKRKEVASVTFLASKAGMPAEHWDVSEAQNGSVVAWVTPAGNDLYDLAIAADGVTGAPADCSRMFFGYENAASITFNGNFDTANVADMSYMFTACTRLAGLDVGGWDTSSVTDMSGMFRDCTGLAALDLSNWDTADVTDMSWMFDGCTGLTALEVSGWDTANVTNMEVMFQECSGLTALDVSGWNTANLTDMNYLFYGCSSLTELGVGAWNVTNVTNMWAAFYGCSGLTGLDISCWDTSRVANMRYMFGDCTGLTQLDVSGWDTSSVTNMYGMFWNCTGLTQLDFGGWNTASLTDMSGMFEGCLNLTALNFSGWDTSNVTNMHFQFNGCASLTALDLSGWDTSSVTDMQGVFNGCASLTALDLSGWDTSSVTDMQGVFNGCASLTALDLSGWNTASVTNMSYLFYGCSSLTELDIGDWNIANVTEMWAAFYGCSGLTGLNVSRWDTSRVTNMRYMFGGCTGLTALDASGWDTSGVTNMYGMFWNCTGLTKLDFGGWNTASLTDMTAMFEGCLNLTALNFSGWDTSNVTSMQNIFFNCGNLTELDVSGWDTANVTNMYALFYGCSALTTVDVSGWDTSSVTDMSGMFGECTSLTTLDVSGWNTANVTNMQFMFDNCPGLHGKLDLSRWDTSNVEEGKAYTLP